jgi:hypothetical protein
MTDVSVNALCIRGAKICKQQRRVAPVRSGYRMATPPQRVYQSKHNGGSAKGTRKLAQDLTARSRLRQAHCKPKRGDCQMHEHTREQTFDIIRRWRCQQGEGRHESK